MAIYNLPNNIVNRFTEFLNSVEYSRISDYAKSDYWNYHAANVSVKISGNNITVRGLSGYYVPTLKSPIATFRNRVIAGLRNPETVIDFMMAKCRKYQADKRIRLLDYYHAFDAVMTQDSIADIDQSQYRIDFKSLSNKDGVVKSIEEMRRIFFAKIKYHLNPSMVYGYYITNIINGYMNQRPHKVLEIGAGNGNLASVIYHIFGSTIIVVDLPETLCLSIPHLASLFPDAKILMPHESKFYDINAYDFIFLTPDQIHDITDNTIDLSISIGAFQEMTQRQIAEYIELIQRVSHEDSYFLCQSRVEKIPSAFVEKDVTNILTNRFAENPWNPNNKVAIYEICRLIRLVQLDNVYLRLERIMKDS